MGALSSGFRQEKIILLELCGKQAKAKQQSSKRQQTGQTEITADIFLGPYSKLGVPGRAEQKTEKEVFRRRMGDRTLENSGPGSVHYSSVTD